MDLDARMEVTQGDLTTLDVDAIVNAANHSLLGGGGVDGAIHSKAGPELLEECRRLDGCNTGEAKLTKGYNLLAGHVIHTVGPVWDSEGGKEDDLLADCYRNSLALAVENGFATIAFPCISTGIYGFPADRAAEIVLATVNEFLKTDATIRRVIFCCFNESDVKEYDKARTRLLE